MTSRAHPAPILVTGAFGNVGRFVLRELIVRGHRIVATDVDSKSGRAAAREFADHPDVTVEWADLRDASAIRDLVAARRPAAIVHLAAVIPPGTFLAPDLARAVNVDSTRHLIDAVSGLEERCRFVFASSIATYGARNPHSFGPMTADEPLLPRDLYGAHKAECESMLRASGIDWVILRLGAVVFHDMELALDAGTAYLESLLPRDGRLHSVDARDVASAFGAAVEVDCLGETLLIGGDESHQMTSGDLTRDFMTAAGLGRAVTPGLPGDPADDDSWFCVDWMDTARAQELLAFQDHTWARTLADVRTNLGLLPYLLPLIAPLLKPLLARRSAYHRSPLLCADPWGGIASKWGAGALVDPASRGPQSADEA